jgi:hypothetical protein
MRWHVTRLWRGFLSQSFITKANRVIMWSATSKRKVVFYCGLLVYSLACRPHTPYRIWLRTHRGELSREPCLRHRLPLSIPAVFSLCWYWLRKRALECGWSKWGSRPRCASAFQTDNPSGPPSLYGAARWPRSISSFTCFFLVPAILFTQIAPL